MAGARQARADIVAGYLQGHGGVDSVGGDRAAPSPVNAALGAQLGLRVLVFEGYGDFTTFGGGTSVTRGILGLRGAIGLGGVRLILRGGAGGIAERGGALTGRLAGAPDRNGGVVRAGVALEKKLADTFWGGVGLDGEAFSLSNPGAPPGIDSRIQGTDIFASLHLKFELGI